MEFDKTDLRRVKEWLAGGMTPDKVHPQDPARCAELWTEVLYHQLPQKRAKKGWAPYAIYSAVLSHPWFRHGGNMDLLISTSVPDKNGRWRMNVLSTLARIDQGSRLIHRCLMAADADKLRRTPFYRREHHDEAPNGCTSMLITLVDIALTWSSLEDVKRLARLVEYSAGAGFDQSPPGTPFDPAAARAGGAGGAAPPRSRALNLVNWWKSLYNPRMEVFRFALETCRQGRGVTGDWFQAYGRQPLTAAQCELVLSMFDGDAHNALVAWATNADKKLLRDTHYWRTIVATLRTLPTDSFGGVPVFLTCVYGSAAAARAGAAALLAPNWPAALERNWERKTDPHWLRENPGIIHLGGSAPPFGQTALPLAALEQTPVFRALCVDGQRRAIAFVVGMYVYVHLRVKRDQRPTAANILALFHSAGAVAGATPAERCRVFGLALAAGGALARFEVNAENTAAIFADCGRRWLHRWLMSDFNEYGIFGLRAAIIALDSGERTGTYTTTAAALVVGLRALLMLRRCIRRRVAPRAERARIIRAWVEALPPSAACPEGGVAYAAAARSFESRRRDAHRRRDAAAAAPAEATAEQILVAILDPGHVYVTPSVAGEEYTGPLPAAYPPCGETRAVLARTVRIGGITVSFVASPTRTAAGYSLVDTHRRALRRAGWRPAGGGASMDDSALLTQFLRKPPRGVTVVWWPTPVTLLSSDPVARLRALMLPAPMPVDGAILRWGDNSVLVPARMRMRIADLIRFVAIPAQPTIRSYTREFLSAWRSAQAEYLGPICAGRRVLELGSARGDVRAAVGAVAAHWTGLDSDIIAIEAARQRSLPATAWIWAGAEATTEATATATAPDVIITPGLTMALRFLETTVIVVETIDPACLPTDGPLVFPDCAFVRRTPEADEGGPGCAFRVMLPWFPEPVTAIFHDPAHIRAEFARLGWEHTPVRTSEPTLAPDNPWGQWLRAQVRFSFRRRGAHGS
jgi:hypothetical protein